MLPTLIKSIQTTVAHFALKKYVKVSKKTKSQIENLRNKVDFPPNYYRTMDIFPTTKEVLSVNCDPTTNCFVKRRYDNVEHYLDVKFRLWKEIFLAPLRQDIAKCIAHIQGDNPNTKPSNVTMYSGVVFKSFFTIRNGIGATIKFANQGVDQNIYSSNTPGFTDGKIICFTKDNFASIFFGRVITRGANQLLSYSYIGFEPTFSNYDLINSYTVVVCDAYFHHCYYVLKNLQGMSQVDFPMKRYLVEADFSPEKPDYLVGKASVYYMQRRRVHLFHNSWPCAELLKLDRFQYSAFKAALTQKFCMIQGAPGTGKTYLGVQIVKTLLHTDNKKYWFRDAPILIIALTSENLNQFLEGLISATKKILSVNKELTSGKLTRFTMGNFNTTNLSDYNKITLACRRKSKALEKDIKIHIQSLITINNLNHIIKMTHFSIIDKKIKTSWFSRASNDQLLQWLFDGSKSQNINPHSIEISEILSFLIEVEDKPSPENNNCWSAEDQKDISTHTEYILISQSELVTQMGYIRDDLKLMESYGIGTGDITELHTQLQDLWQKFQYLKMRMSNRAFFANPIKPTNTDYHSPHNMAVNDRWNLYFYWLDLYKIRVEQKSVELQHHYREASLALEEISNICHSETMNKAQVVGMTLANASHMKTVLQTLKCRIVLVEDGSEVLESYVVSLLTKHCQHLIIMGNHQKIYPVIPDEFTNSGISLMERITNNKMQYYILGIQYRMKTKISKLLLPRIYPELKLEIGGVISCIIFVNRKNQGIAEDNAKINFYQAKFLINFTRYLLKNSHYKPEDIIILTDYFYQAMALRKQIGISKRLVKNVKICNLANYRGEEYTIIILSLMRTTFAEETEVLKYENSVIYALSQAKDGVLMMGNLDLLCENSEVWCKIRNVIMNHKCLINY